jgi:hypothetical protein
VPDLLGLPATFAFRGKEYPVKSPPDFQVEAEFSRWVEQGALLLIQRNRAVMTPEVYAEQMAGWRRDGAARKYQWMGEVCIDARYSYDGCKELAWLMLARAEALLLEHGQKPQHPVTRELVDAVFADPEARRAMQDLVWGVPAEQPSGGQADPLAGPGSAPPAQDPRPAAVSS